jgi:hypothetical protein
MSLKACTAAWVDQRLNDGEFPALARVSEDCTSNLSLSSNQICHLVRLKPSPIRKPEFQRVTLRFSRQHNRCYRICDRLAGCDLGRSADQNQNGAGGGAGGVCRGAAGGKPDGSSIARNLPKEVEP